MASPTLWPALLVVVAACLGSVAQAAIVPPYRLSSLEGRRLRLVSQQFDLTYHNGPILTSPISVCIIWYGGFTNAQKNIILDFIRSLSPSAAQAKLVQQPSVASWWSVIGDYKDRKNLGVSKTVTLGGQCDNSYSLGKKLTTKQIESIVITSLPKLGTNSNPVYLVLTAADVQVDDFCVSSCGSHSTVMSAKKKLVYAWVGNPGTQCAGMCAWPFASPVYAGAPKFTALLPPNGDVGCDGMIITIASVLAGCATNPDNSGLYQGESGYPLEAATSCQGLFGAGSFAGSPGILLKDKKNRSFNAYGINNREFLVPALWNPRTRLCKTWPK
jgi:hypothetical protein